MNKATGEKSANVAQPLVIDGQVYDYYPKPPKASRKYKKRTVTPVPRLYARDAEAGTGLFEESGPTLRAPDEPYPAFLGRLMANAGIGSTLAHAIGLETEGYDGTETGNNAVYLGHLLAHHSTAMFRSDPTPVRGRWKAEVQSEDFWRSKPEVALNVGVLRSLQFSNDLKPGDLAVLWTLVGHVFAGGSLADLSFLRRRYRLSRMQDALFRLETARFSLIDEPTIPHTRWVKDAAVLEVTDGTVRFSSVFLDLARPRMGGSRYGHVELTVLRRMRAAWQEGAYRSFLAAAVTAGIYWSDGGYCDWMLTPVQASAVFSNSKTTVKSLRKDRISPFSKLLNDAESRMKVLECTPIRRPNVRGRASDSLSIFFELREAHYEIKPRSGVFLKRTEARREHSTSDVELIGLGRVDEAAKRLARSEAAARGHRNRKSKAKPTLVTTDSINGEKCWIDEMFAELSCSDNEAAPNPGIEEIANSAENLENVHGKSVGKRLGDVRLAGKPPKQPTRKQILEASSGYAPTTPKTTNGAAGKEAIAPTGPSACDIEAFPKKLMIFVDNHDNAIPHDYLEP